MISPPFGQGIWHLTELIQNNKTSVGWPQWSPFFKYPPKGLSQKIRQSRKICHRKSDNHRKWVTESQVITVILIFWFSDFWFSGFLNFWIFDFRSGCKEIAEKEDFGASQNIGNGIGNLVATINFSPFTCCFRRFFRHSFTGFFCNKISKFT